MKKSLGVPGSSAGFDGHGNDGIVDINDVELTLAPTYFGSERVRVRVTQIQGDPSDCFIYFVGI